MSDQPSSSTETTIDEVKNEREASVPPEECSICRGDQIEDKTILDSCIHSFCYKCITEWLKYSNGPICPMCKQTINKMHHSLDENPPKTESAMLIYQQAHRNNHVNREDQLIIRQNQFNVSRILRVVWRKYRRLAVECDQRQSVQTRTRNSQAQNAKNDTYKSVIIQHINAIQLLKDEITDGSRREFIFLQTSFRKLIYIEKLKLITPPNHSVFLFPSNATGIPDFREKMVPFLVDEFKAIPVKYNKGKSEVPTEFVHDKLNGRDEEMANRIVTFITREGIEKSSSASRLADMINARTQDVLILCQHIRAYAHHAGSFLDFLKNIDYTLAEVLPSSSTRSGQNGNLDEVVLNDEDDDDDGSNYLRARNTDFLNRMRAIQRINNSLFPMSSYQTHPAVNLRSMFNRQSTSESDGDSHLYERPQLSIQQALSSFQNTLNSIVHPQPSATSWRELTSDYVRPRPQSVDDSVVVLSDDEVAPISSNSDNNATIILDELLGNGNQPSSSRHRHRRIEKRKLPGEREDNRNKRKNDDDDSPPGFNDAMYRLLNSFAMSRTSDIDKITRAGELALKKIRAEKRANVDALASSSSPSTSSEDRSSQNS